MAYENRVFRISLIVVLLAAALFCVYSVWNYSSHDNNQSITDQGSTRFQNFNIHNHQSGDRFQNSDSTRHRQTSNGRISSGMGIEGAEYALLFITYAVIFLAAFTIIYYLYIYKKIRINPTDEKLLILTLLCAGLLFRISVSTLINGHPYDINTFRSWATAAANNIFQVYSGPRPSDYPPLYMYILFLIGKVANFPAVNPYFTLLLKLPSELADIATALLIYKLARRYMFLEISILAAAFYIFNPAVIINSTVWGQVDSFFTFMVTLSLYWLSENKLNYAAILFTATVLMKPQGIIFLPVLFFEIVRVRDLKNILKAAVFSLSTAAVILFPFSLNWGAFWIFKLFSGTVAEYPYASVNAFNFFSLIGKNYASDAVTMLGFSYHSWGLFFVTVITAISWLMYHKAKNNKFAAAAALVLIAGVFTFSTSMHERYLFPAVALSIITFIYLRDNRLLLLAAGFSITVYINTHYILFSTISGVNQAAYNLTLVLISLLNILLFIYLLKILIDVVKYRGRLFC